MLARLSLVDQTCAKLQWKTPEQYRCNLFNICAEAYLGICQTSMMEVFFFENNV